MSNMDLVARFKNLCTTLPMRLKKTTLHTFKIREAAKFLGVSQYTLRRWGSVGKIKPLRTGGGTRLFALSELEKVKDQVKGTTLSISEVAKKLNVSTKTLRRWDEAGKLVASRNSTGERVYDLGGISKLISPVKDLTILPKSPEPYTKPVTPSLIDQYLRPSSLNYPKSPLVTARTPSVGRNDLMRRVTALGIDRNLLSFKSILIGGITVSLATLAITGSLVAGYLTSPAGTKSLMSAAVSSPLSPFNSLVLAATNKRPGVITFNADTIINADTTLQGSISLEGTVIKGLVQTITAGSNIAVVNGDTPNPTISVTLPTNLVNSFATSSTGTKVSGDIIIGSGLSLATDTKTITASTPTLSTVRSAGGCSGCLTDSDVADTITISSSGSVDVGALSGKVTAAKGGLGADVTPAGAGELLYSTSTSAYGHLAAGTSTYVLTSGGAGVPVWVAQSSIASSTAFNDITSGTNTQAAMVVSTGASLTYNGGTATSGVINANQLLGATWAAPGTIGSGTATTRSEE